MAAFPPLPPGPDLSDNRRFLTEVLLRLPNDPLRERSLVWRRSLERYPPLGQLVDYNPLAGIGTQASPDGWSVVLLAEHDIHPDLVDSVQGLGVDLPVRVWITGPIVLALEGGESLSGDCPQGDTGTFACLVEDAQGTRYLLGCNHTLAGIDKGTNQQDTVRHPGAADGGQLPQDVAGTLVDYEKILVGGNRTNRMDAAIAAPADLAAVAKGISQIGNIAGVGGTLSHGDLVRKTGWKTRHTVGEYRFMASLTATLPTGAKALFVDQYAIAGIQTTGFAAQGDSGAAVLTHPGDELVGMVIAVDSLPGGSTLAFATPFGEIQSRFNIAPVL